jgi:SH3-like domain-containing protein
MPKLRLPILRGLAAAAIAAGVLAPTAAGAQESAPDRMTTGSIGPSGLPLPRFVSLKSAKVNLRVGPGLNYAVDWMYLKSGLPMEIIQEYDNWRKVRDADGTEGWINQSLLSGRRTAIVTPWQRGKDARLSLRRAASEDAPLVAEIEPGVIGTIRTCNGEWCEMEFSGTRGWMSQAQVWGAYPGETVAD